MGICLSQQPGVENIDGDTSRALFFHPITHGSQVLLDEFHHVAERGSSFHDGIVFTNRPIQLHEKVTLKILKKEARWHGGLRVGFTSMDPSKMDPGHLPPFVCPHLVMQGKTWAAVLPDQCIEEGTILMFWVDHRGRVFFRSQQEARNLPLLTGVPVRGRLWAVIDVYGQTKAVQLLDPTRLRGGICDPAPAPRPSYPARPHAPACRDYSSLLGGDVEECVICCSHEANALLQPCGHATLCHCCAQEVFHNNQPCPFCREQIQDIVQVIPGAPAPVTCLPVGNQLWPGGWMEAGGGGVSATCPSE
uniref:Neuralized E3 ubiquitin protein ligase 3 n=1 Tax=Chrysemys picta bellii TaxID=8478 RepID=A0A8C3IHN5_CHRPI|nr:E3 ubiquitin-protein ligase NEURL3 [Chrysemys picta bellii]